MRKSIFFKRNVIELKVLLSKKPLKKDRKGDFHGTIGIVSERKEKIIIFLKPFRKPVRKVIERQNKLKE